MSLSIYFFFPVALLDSHLFISYSFNCTPCSRTPQLTTPTLQCSCSGIREQQRDEWIARVFSLGFSKLGKQQELVMWGIKLQNCVGQGFTCGVVGTDPRVLQVSQLHPRSLNSFVTGKLQREMASALCSCLENVSFVLRFCA